MQRSVQKWLWDVRDGCERIAGYVKGRTYEDYIKDGLLRDAVERRLSIIGEALIQATRQMPELKDLVSRHSDIVGFRNILIHDYPRIEQDRVWGIVVKHLPVLLAEVHTILPKPDDPTFPHEDEE